MNLWQKYKLWRAWNKCKDQIKEAMQMADKPMVRSRMSWGGIFLALGIFAGKALPLVGFPEWADAVQVFFLGLAGAFGVIGLRGVLGGIKDKLGD